MKATGEVMAIDRTFGAGAEQGAPRPRAGGRRAARRGPELDAGVRLPRRRLRRRRRRRREDDEPIRWVDETGAACESTRHAQRTAAPIVLRRFLEPSDSRLWRLLGLLRRGVPEATIQEATGIAPWFLAEMARNVALEAEVRRGRRGPARCAGDEPSGEAATLLATAKRAGFGDRELAGDGRGRRRRTCAARGCASACGRATRWSTPAPPSSPPRRRTSTRRTPPPGSAPEAPPVDRPGRPRHRLAARSGSGRGSSSTTARSSAAQTLRERGWQAVMINSNPETVSTDFDASARGSTSSRSTRRASGASSRPRRRAATTRCRRSSRTAARRRSTSPRHLAAGRRAAPRQRPRGDRPGRGADALLGAARPARHPPARGRDGPQHRGGA